MIGSVLITGGSGVVGGAVIRHFVAAGWQVKALARSEEAAATVEGLGARSVPGDLAAIGPLIEAMAGSDLVVNVAGLNTMCPDHPSDLFSVNVDGARRVVRACGAAGVGRLIHTSSAAAVGTRGGRGWSDYAESKWQADEVIRAEAPGLGVEAVLVAPVSVQGPGRATGTGKLIAALVDGKLPVMVDTAISIVDIDDCGAAHVAAATRGEPGERYVVSGFTIETRQAVDRLATLAGIDLKVRFVPGRLAGLAGPAGSLIGRLTGQDLCAAMVRSMTQRHEHDGATAAAVLGISYRSPDETLRRLLEWFRDEGIVSRPMPGLQAAPTA